jgi:hypothetical protein
VSSRLLGVDEGGVQERRLGVLLREGTVTGGFVEGGPGHAPHHQEVVVGVEVVEVGDVGAGESHAVSRARPERNFLSPHRNADLRNSRLAY